jgi:hypothetical protein
MGYLPVLLAFVGSQLAPSAGQPVPLGPELVLDAQVSHGMCPAITGHADGAFAVMWYGTTATSRGGGVMVRTADAEGVFAPPLSITESDMGFLRSLTTADEGYRLGWEHFGREGHVSQIETLDRSGRITSSASFNHWTGKGWLSPRLTGYDDRDHWLSLQPTGNYVATWIGSGLAESQRGSHLLVQLLDPQGRPISALTAWEASPAFFGVPGCGLQAVRVLHHPSNGEFAVVWEEMEGVGQESIDRGTLGRRFAADGTPLGGIVPLLPAPPADKINIAAAAIGADGTMAMASAVASRSAPYRYGHVRLRTFAADGTVAGNTVVVPRWRSSAETSFPQSIAVDPDGNVLLVWTQYADGAAEDAFARVYSRLAVPQGPAFRFTSGTNASNPGVAGATAGWAGNAWLIAWTSVGPSSGDPVRCGCAPDPVFQAFVRRFSRK